MIGRESLRRTLAAAVDDARAGLARTIVLRGEPGSGKTTLLDAAAADGMVRTIRIAGHVAERDLPYAGIHQLMYAAKLTEVITVPGRDPLRDASALLEALTTLAATGPLLLVVDDAQWLDQASRRALVFVARRLDADAVCLLFGIRSAHADELAVGTPVDLEPLSREDSLALLHSLFPELTARVAARIAEHGAGLPLALCEIPAELSPAQRCGTDPLPAVLPLGRSLTQLFAKRLDALTDRGRLVLLAASFDPLDAATYRSVLAALGCSLDDLDGAERSGLVRVQDGCCVFRHPSVPAAIQNAARSRELIEVHRALAAEFVEDPVRAAAHLKHDPGADRGLLLRAARAGAHAAGQARTYADAAELWETAAGLSAEPAEARSCLRQAAKAHVLAGAGPEAHTLIERLLRDTRDETERADLLRDLTSISLWSRSVAPEDSEHIQSYSAELVRAADETVQAAGVDLSIALATAALAAGEFRRARQICVALLTHAAGRLTLEQRLLCDVTAVMVGEPGAGAELRGDWTADYPWQRVLDPATPAGFITVVLGWLGEHDILEDVIARCRQTMDEHGPSASGMYVAASMTATHERHRGRWDRALLEFDAIERLVIDTDFAAPYPFIALRHAHLLAARGDRAGCEQLRRQAREKAPVWTRMMAHLDHCVGGLLALAHRDFAAAASDLHRAGEIERDTGTVPSGYLSRVADAFEAAWRLGKAGSLRDQLDYFEAAMRSIQHREMLGLAARCRALVVAPDEMDTRFAEAVALLDREPDGFEAARARLLWGERLRRERRKADAHEKLFLAHETFTRLGATRWAEQCNSELAACGIRRITFPSLADGPATRLTPREFEVAREVASGMTNADAARRLFISERTVEFHLSRVFRKLEIKGRHELAGALDV